MKEHTLITLDEVKQRCKRKNAKANNELHWFASKFSIYFSYIFIKLKLSADQVTIVFLLTGLFGSVLYSFNSLGLTILGYIFFRLHIIIDMSDGDVARFNKSFSIRGAYWDAVIHSVVNPLYYVLISYSFFIQFGNELFLVLGAFTGISSSILMAAKNNYYKAMFLNKQTYKPKETDESLKKSFKFKLFFLLSETLSIEGFVLLTILVRFIDIEKFGLLLLLLYLSANLFIFAIKFHQLSYKGYYQTKS